MGRRSPIAFALIVSTACSEQREVIGNAFDSTGDDAGGSDAGEAADGGDATGTTSTDGGTPATTATSSPETTATHESTAEADSAMSGVRFDLGSGLDVPTADDGGTKEGCEKVDFLFVVDNSGSMGAHQTNLINSFGPFIDTIYDTLPAQDFRIMAVDSDAGDDLLRCEAACNWCEGWCTARTTLTLTCEQALGAGEVAPFGVSGASNAICEVPDGKRYLTSALTKAEIKDKFACMAKTGTAGSAAELPMSAMVQAVTMQNQPGGCNEGFVRDDAVLVVTVISDDIPTKNADNASVVGTPQEWFDGVVLAKRGLVNNVVMLGIVNDENATCIGNTDGVDRTGPTMRFLDFIAMFGARGVVGNVCDPDYNAFFEQAVGLIQTACMEFVPPE